MAKNKTIPSDLLEWLDQSDTPPLQPKKFADKALAGAEQMSGGAAWDSAAELWKLIDTLPKAKREAFKENLEVVLVALHSELATYKTQEGKKAQVGNTNGAKYSSELVKQAITKFKSLPDTLSQIRRAELTAASLSDPKPTAKTILNWIKNQS